MATGSDDFNRANAATLGANWTEDSGTFGINTNAAEMPTGADYRKARYTATAPATADHYSRVTCQSAASTLGRGSAVRATVGAAVTYYAGVGFGGDAFYLVEITATVETILDTGPAMTANTNYVVETRAVGTALSVLIDAVEQMTATDASLTALGWGLAAFGPNGTNSRWDEWSGADIGGGGGAPRLYMTLNGRMWGSAA